MASEVFDLVVRGKAKLVGAAVQAALDAGTDPNALLADMIGAMDEVGVKFKNNARRSEPITA